VYGLFVPTAHPHPEKIKRCSCRTSLGNLVRNAALAAHVAERASATAVADVLELDFDAVGGVNQNLGGRALSQPRPRAHAMLGEPRFDLIGCESLDSESYVRPEGCRPTSLDQRDELRS